jgi:predicted Zn-ribbon and HTH transcriptional regulator
VDDSIPDEVKESINALPDSVKSKMLLVTDEQVYDHLHMLIKEIGDKPVQVVFRDSQCLDCGAQGDARLLDTHCHMEMLMVHPQPAAYFHPSTQVKKGAKIQRGQNCSIV